MAGTNLGAEVVSGTLWIREVSPIVEVDGTQLAISAACVGTPPTTADTFAHGCLIIQLDNSGENVSENTGTSASPSWTLLGSL